MNPFTEKVPPQISELLNDIQQKINESIELALGVGINTGIISVRQTEPLLIREMGTDRIRLAHSITIDYLGAEKIEELQTEVAYLKQINGDLHKALTEFYEKARPNQWLRNQP